jgi:hypothetical protein
VHRALRIINDMSTMISLVAAGNRRTAGTRTRFVRRRNWSSKDEVDLLTNGGTVEGVWIFCRHGDRAPSRPLCPAHLIDEEASFWRNRLPLPDSMAAFQAFSKSFSPDIHVSNQGKFLDTRRAPFGFLTHTGLQQTRENGLRLFNRYNRHGHHLPDCEQYLNAKDFLDVWDMRVYSTNYLRTVMSVQSFLDGLLGTDCYSSLRENMAADERDGMAQSVDDFRVPDHSSVPAPTEEDSLLRIQVRGRDEDTLNAFDRYPDLMADLVAEVISSPAFQEGDGAAAPHAARLANILPGLARKKNNATGYNAAPSGINWIEATDHFVCRTAHNLKFSKFSEFEHDDRVEHTLKASTYFNICVYIYHSCCVRVLYLFLFQNSLNYWYTYLLTYLLTNHKSGVPDYGASQLEVQTMVQKPSITGSDCGAAAQGDSRAALGRTFIGSG